MLFFNITGRSRRFHQNSRYSSDKAEIFLKYPQKRLPLQKKYVIL
jgi:hypothetical protein